LPPLAGALPAPVTLAAAARPLHWSPGMTNRFLRTLSFSLLTLAAGAALTGCPGTEHDARFADATDQQLERAYAASSGSDLASALVIGMLLSGGTSDPGACPTIATDGQDTTVTGGCTTDDGDRWDGTIEIHNLPAAFADNPAYDPTAPGSIAFDLRITPLEGEVVELSGSVELDEEAQTITGDLTVDSDGLATTSRLALGCDDDNLCTASPDSELEIEGLGGAAVEGTWRMADPPTGTISLRGADVLVFDLATRDADGCVAYEVGDATGTVCDPDGGEDQAFAPRTTWAARVERAAR
jgi:hypothetical protein